VGAGLLEAPDVRGLSLAGAEEAGCIIAKEIGSAFTPHQNAPGAPFCPLALSMSCEPTRGWILPFAFHRGTILPRPSPASTFISVCLCAI
jgi:hypothetical protein